MYRTTKHKYRIIFNDSTLFRKIEPVNGSTFLCCANFRDIKRGLYHPMYCLGKLTMFNLFLDCHLMPLTTHIIFSHVDLCGALIRVGDLIATKTYQHANIYHPILYSLEFSLIDLGFELFRCQIC